MIQFKIVIELFRHRLQITSPGRPPGGQPIELIAEGRGLSRPRNPLVVQGLTWLEPMDDCGSGIKRMRAAMAERNLVPPVFGPEFNAITLSITPEANPEVTPEVFRMLSAINGEMTRREIQQALGLRDEKHFRERYQQVAVRQGLIEMTKPSKHSSNQKCRLTPKGRTLVQKLHRRLG